MARGGSLPELQADVYLSRAFILFRQQNYVSSEHLFQCALEIGEQVGGWYYHGHALWGIGKNLMIQGQYYDAMPWLKQSLGIFEDAGARLSIAMVWSELAVCYLGLDEDEKALELLRKAERVKYESGFVHNYQVVLANIGTAHLHRGDHFTAGRHTARRPGPGTQTAVF